MHCLVIQHVSFEDLGTFEPVLRANGFNIEYFHSGVDAVPQEAWENADLTVVLGGPISVNDCHIYPYIEQEISLIKSRLNVGKPLLGICLGAQMIAAALGARVYAGKKQEIGWGGVLLSNEGKHSCLSALAVNVPVLHWHGDTFDLPDGAVLLASTDITPHQAFSYKDNVLALQFHPEADGQMIEKWLIGHTCELAQNNIDPRMIRDATKRAQLQATAASQRLLSAWLRHAELLP